MMSCDRNCVHCQYDPSTGIGDCELDIEGDCNGCSDFYDRESAMNDAKLRFAPEGKN